MPPSQDVNDLWDNYTAQAVGGTQSSLILTDQLSHPRVLSDYPEIPPGAFIGTPTRAADNGDNGTGSFPGEGPNVEAIAGGVAALAVIGGLVFYILLQRSRPQAPSAAFVIDGATPTTPATPMMLCVRLFLVSDRKSVV